MKTLALIALPALLLAGCDENITTEKTGNTIAINADSDNGQVAIETPIFEAKVKVPGEIINKSSFELDGVKLFPGSKVTGVNVGAGDGSNNKVTVSFASPASQADVREYFVKAFADQKIDVAKNGTGLSGTDKDGKAFSITLTDDGAAKTAGTIVMGE